MGWRSITWAACIETAQVYPQDHKEAVNWYRKSAEQSYAAGQRELGRMSFKGRGVAKDYKEAVKWYRMAAEQGFASAQSDMGFCFDNGLGVPQDYKEAIKWYRMAAEQGDAVAQSNLGAMYSGGRGVPKDYKAALNWFRKSAEQGNELGLYNLAVSYEKGESVPKDLSQAFKLFQQAADKELAPACYKVGWMYDQGVGVPRNREEAVKWYKKAAELGNEEAKKNLILPSVGSAQSEKQGIAIFNEAKDLYGKARSKEDREKALMKYQQALEIFRKARSDKWQGVCLNQLGFVYHNFGHYSKALEHYEKSLAICNKVGDVKGEGATLNNIASVYRNWGQYQKALEYYEMSLVIARKIGNVAGEGGTLNNIGLVYDSLGQYQKALEHCEKSLMIRRNIGDVKGEGATLENLGAVYQHIGKYDDALASLQKALEIYSKIGVPIRATKEHIGNLYLDGGELDKAEHFIKEAPSAASVGRLCLLKSDYAAAKKNYEISLTSAEKNRNADTLFAACTGLGFAYEGAGDDNRAKENFAKAVSLIEDLRASLPRDQRETFFDFKIHGFLRTAPYDGLARVLMKLNKPLDALEESEYTKSRVFAEALSKRAEGSVAHIPKKIMDIDFQLNDQLAALTKNFQDAYGKGDKEAAAYLEPRVKQAKEKLAIHIEMLRKQYPLFAVTKYPQPMNLAQADLRDNEWSLAYHLTDPGIMIYLTKSKNLVKSLFKPVPRKDIDELVRKFREPMEIGTDDSPAQKLGHFDFASGKKLSDLLLADILSDLSKNTPVIIIPDGSLGVVPFEMLVSE